MRLRLFVLLSILLKITNAYPDYCTIEDGFYYKENVRIVFTEDEVVNEKKGDTNMPALYNAVKHIIDTWDSDLTELY